jgi:hypothetical protein
MDIHPLQLLIGKILKNGGSRHCGKVYKPLVLAA